MNKDFLQVIRIVNINQATQMHEFYFTLKKSLLRL